MSKYYITRDVYGELAIFTNRPTKNIKDGRWKSNCGLSYKIPNVNFLFPEVKWEDEEPTEVELEIKKKV